MIKLFTVSNLGDMVARVEPLVRPNPRIRVGIDILAVERVSRLLRENAGIEDEVFTAREIAYCAGARGRTSISPRASPRRRPC